MRDLNSQHPSCKGGALPVELIRHICEEEPLTSHNRILYLFITVNVTDCTHQAYPIAYNDDLYFDYSLDILFGLFNNNWTG